MNISALNLSENANVYVDHGILRKWRGTDPEGTVSTEKLQQKVSEATPLSELEIDLMKRLDRVVIESENAIEFYNFTGVIKKY